MNRACRVASSMLLLLFTASVSLANDIDFSRDIQPILADRCFHCHGPDASNREADLRLDDEASAKSEREGKFVIQAGNPKASELVHRVFSDDEDLVMPPADSDRHLSEQEKETLKLWIQQGAEWRRHWAFDQPARPTPPTIPDDTWSHNNIDRFLLANMTAKGWRPSLQATKSELIRRVSLDLTGLPPTLDELDAFLADKSEHAFERVVDRLFKSPRYGEHMARAWLDAARYADTDGYQNDGPRSMWRWRDWVIDAYNQGMPFDQFTIEQLAGDLVPNPTMEQRLATGFNRNHRYNSEAGIVLEEFLLENAIDRVNTTATVWMGLTMGCARCHDHKYDPFNQQEYYQLISFFDNVSESGRAVKFGNSEPWVLAPTKPQQIRLTELDADLQAANANMHDKLSALDRQIADWSRTISDEEQAKQNQLAPSISTGLAHRYRFDQADPRVGDRKQPAVFAPGLKGKALQSDGKSATTLKDSMSLSCQSRFSISFWLYIDEAKDGVVLSQQASNTRRPGLSVELADGRLQFYLITRWISGVGAVQTKAQLPNQTWVHMVLTNDGTQSATGMQIAINGEPAATDILYNTNSNTGGAGKGASLRFGKGVHGQAFRGRIDDLRFYSRTLYADEVQQVAQDHDVEKLAARWIGLTDGQRDTVRRWFWEHQASPDLNRLWRAREKSRSARRKFRDSLPTSMVMAELEPRRPTYVRERGEYLRRKQAVQPATPTSLGDLGPLPRNRLGFAKWLVSGKHPLTARVAVNRYWQQFFAGGLVGTAEDFGVQGEAPSHPALLDWLATEFVRTGWNIKETQKQIVMSAAYQQSSRTDKAGIERDPANTWLTRGPRQRLSAHELRDQALYLGGLLVEQRGGPSVSPYQPANLWREMSNMSYRQSKGDDLYRRSLYTIWKRTVAPPSLTVLDAADRESCIVQPRRTNTPLQALTLMNETAFVESARALGEQMLIRGGDDPIGFGFRTLTARMPTTAERAILESAREDARRAFEEDAKAARQLIGIGASKPDPKLDPVRLAVQTVLANLMFNLDEVVSKQ